MSKKKVSQVKSEESAPILTLDGVPMRQGMEVFMTKREWNHAKSAHLITEYVERSVVVALSRVNRYFILRCAKGCETKVKLTNGCSIGTFGEIPFADINNAFTKIREYRLTNAKTTRANAMKLLAEADMIEQHHNDDIEVK